MKFVVELHTSVLVKDTNRNVAGATPDLTAELPWDWLRAHVSSCAWLQPFCKLGSV